MEPPLGKSLVIYVYTFFSPSSSVLWVVGGAFLQNVYTVFDLGQTRVGFATLK
jgi:Eukaryotic aspartyl protease